MTILVITTGGTIGAMSYPNPQNPPKITLMPEDGADYVHDFFRERGATECISMPYRDSKLIDDDYREQMLRHIKQSDADRIIITHGTDRILQTTDYFYHKQAEVPPLKDKFILLTGSMIPLANGRESDGFQNLEYAYQQLNILKQSGIYIVLSDYDDVKTKTGWSPRLYTYEPNIYEKYYDPEDQQRNRIWRIRE